MRHQKHGKKLGRTSDHRDALWSNMVASLIVNERVTTTDAKAKELKRIAERTINWSTSLGDLLTKDDDKLDAEDRSRKVHAIRMARRVVKQPEALAKLFDDVGARFIGRPGGYTRVLKLGYRHGDAAPVSIVELVVRAEQEEAATEAPPKAATEKKAPKAKASDAGEGAAEKPAKAPKAPKAEAAPKAEKAAPKKAAAKAEAAGGEAKPKKKAAKKSEE